MGSEYVAECPLGWGRAASEYDAIAQMAARIDPRPGETLTVCLTRCEGFHGGAYGEVDADVILNEKTVELPTDPLIEMQEHMSEVEVLAEEAMVESEVLD